MLAVRPTSGSDTSTPSNWNLTSSVRPPRKWRPSADDTTPALVPIACIRLSTGISRSFSAVMLCLVVEDLTSIRFSPRTSISSRVLTIFESFVKEKLTVVVTPAFTWTVWTCFSKPSGWTWTWTEPTGTPTRTKPPFSSVKAPKRVPRTMMLAKAIGSLFLSVTLPAIRPTPDVAAGAALAAGAA